MVHNPSAAASAPDTIALGRETPPPEVSAGFSLTYAPSFALDRDLESGCFAWSTTELAAACVLGSANLEHGGRYSVAFVGSKTKSVLVTEFHAHEYGPHPLILDETARGLVEARLRDGQYTPITTQRVVLAPGEQHALDETATVQLRQRTLARVKRATGQWSQTELLVEVHCKKAVTKPLRHVLANAQAELSVYSMPESRRLLLVLSATWAIEGDSGSVDSASLVALDTCQAATFP